jgi:hypothetical protein
MHFLRQNPNLTFPESYQEKIVLVTITIEEREGLAGEEEIGKS